MQAKSMNILAMAAFGTLAIFVRGIALSPLEIALWRGVIAILVLLVLRLVTPKRPDSRLTWRERGLLLLSGVAVGINWALLFAAYDHTSIAVATLSYYFAPVLVMILSPILFHERMTTLQFTCFLAATLGLVLVVAGGQDLSLGTCWALPSAWARRAFMPLWCCSISRSGAARAWTARFGSSPAPARRCCRSCCSAGISASPDATFPALETF